VKKNGFYILAGSFAVLALSGYLFKEKIKTQFKSKLNDKTKLDFINRIAPSANSIGKSIGVPPLFIIAQLALESAWGRSSLTSKYNNFGGIKAVGNQRSVVLPTKECKNGICKSVYQAFAVYPNVTEGLKAQAKIYQNRNFRKYLNKTSDPMQYAKLLQSKQPRYATALNYLPVIQSTLQEVKRLKTA